MIIAGSFGALGVLLATAIAIFITRSSRRNITVFALLLVLFILTIPHLPDTTLFNRIKTLTNVITLALGGQINLLTISYAEIIYLTGSSDHSFLFRIIHWYQLLTFYFDGPLINQIFGYGIGSTPSMTDSKLIPHNDYLRILLEIGLFGFLGMTLIIIEIVKKLFKKEEAIPVFIILFYFFSENLINSFISVSILFFVAGALLKRFEIISTKNNISH
jgi:O-antigen ligase